MRFYRWSGMAALGLMLLYPVMRVSAHANLARSDPPANASLAQAPVEIRLWFTEPLEQRHSRITLRAATGEVVSAPPSQVDPVDARQMFLIPGDLPDGLYTVVWQALSASDGHLTQGSFPFGIGVAVTREFASQAIDESIAREAIAVRWFNLVAMSLSLGSSAFWLWVWRPAMAAAVPQIDRRQFVMMRAGWALLGIAGGLSLLLQTATTTGGGLVAAAFDPALGSIITDTRFGELWLGRMALWALWGVLLVWVSSPRSTWIALGTGGALLLAHSLFGHASAGPDASAAIIADWLHLSATALWIGGLMAFSMVLLLMRRMTLEERTTAISRTAALFSNYARVLVAAIAITGLYAAWLHIGSVEALLNTVYGRALVVKTLLFMPLLGLAAINLIFTRRGLENGQPIWTGRLRGLVGVEVALALGIFVAVSVMTSGSPARGVQSLRTALVAAPEPAEDAGPDAGPLYVMENASDLHVHVEISPGTVGENTFTVRLYDLDSGDLVTDASLIRMRFENREQNLGESELRPALQDDGAYSVTGSNLSIPGEWRIRTTIQRPGEFDAVVDLLPVVSAVGPGPTPPIIDDTIPLNERLIALLLSGLALLAMGGFFAVSARPAWRGGSGVSALAMILVGGVLLVSGASALRGEARPAGEVRVSDAWMLVTPANFTGGVYLTVDNQSAQPQLLVGARADAARSVEIHQTQITNDFAQMRRVDEIDIPPRSTVVIGPGGYHLMLIDLQHDLERGTRFPLTLIFASGLEIATQVQVVDAPPRTAR